MEDSDLPMVIINYIPDHWSDGRLAEEFGPFSPKKVKLIRDRLTGRSCGYGFIEFGNNEQCQQAIDAISGREVDGKRLKVTWAKPRNEVKFNTNVYVSGLPLDTTERQFAELCEQYGRIVEVRLLTTAASQGSHNTLAAFVRFNKRHESDAFIAAAHGLPIPGFSPQSNTTPSSNTTNNGTASTTDNSSTSNDGNDTKSGTSRRTWVLSARYATDNRTRYKEATGAWLTNSAVDRRANALLNELAQNNNSSNPSPSFTNPKLVPDPLPLSSPYMGNPMNPNPSLYNNGGPPPASSPRNNALPNNNGYPNITNPINIGNQPNTAFQRFPPSHTNNPNYGGGQHPRSRGNHPNNHHHSSHYSNNRSGSMGGNRNSNNSTPNTQYSTNHPQSMNPYYVPSGSLNHPPPHPTTPYWAHPGYENPSGYPYPSQPYYNPPPNVSSIPPGVNPPWNPNYPVRNTGDNGTDRHNDNNSSGWRNGNGLTDTGNGNANTTTNTNSSNDNNVNSNNMDPTMRALDEQLRGLNMNTHNSSSGTVPPNGIPMLSTPTGNITLITAPYSTLNNDPNSLPQHVLNQLNNTNGSNNGNNNVGYTTYPHHPYSVPPTINSSSSPSIPYSTAIFPGGTSITNNDAMKNSSNFSTDSNNPSAYFSIRNVPKNNVNTSINNHHSSEHKDNP